VTWKSLNVEYEAVRSHLTCQECTHPNCMSFVMDDMTFNITRKHLESKSDLVSTVVADQPEEVFIESIKVIGKPYLKNSSSTKCKYKKVSEIVDTIRGMHSSK